VSVASGPVDHAIFEAGDVRLERGGTLRDARLAYVTLGTLSPRRDNVVLMPHMSSATIEGRIAMGEKVIINIKTFVDGHTPPDRVLETMF